MLNIENITKRLDRVNDALAKVREMAIQDKKISGEKNINGHYTKALQELLAVQVQLEKLLQRAKAQNE